MEIKEDFVRISIEKTNWGEKDRSYLWTKSEVSVNTDILLTKLSNLVSKLNEQIPIACDAGLRTECQLDRFLNQNCLYDLKRLCGLSIIKKSEQNLMFSSNGRG